MSTNECRCGKPTRDAAYVCDDCSHALAVALGEISWLDDELEITVTRQKGVDYRTKGGTAGSERPSMVVWTAADARRNLTAVLMAWVRYCHQNNIQNSSPHPGLPAETMKDMAGWLAWRVDGLSLNQYGPTAVQQITRAIGKPGEGDWEPSGLFRYIDRRPEKQYLGNCTCEGGRLYAHSGAAFAHCNMCGIATDAEDLRSKVLRDLEDRLCTADEIAEFSTYLGLKADREQVRKHVEYLGRKTRIARHAAVNGDAHRYRFGEVYQKLVERDYGKKAVS
jgi:hypothetical protein